MFKYLVQAVLTGFVRALGCLRCGGNVLCRGGSAWFCWVAALTSQLPSPRAAARLLLLPNGIVCERILKQPFKCQSSFPQLNALFLGPWFKARHYILWSVWEKEQEYFPAFFPALLHSVRKAITVMHQGRLSSCGKSYSRNFEE